MLSLSRTFILLKVRGRREHGMDVQEKRSSPGCVHGPKSGIQVKLLMWRWQKL